MCFRSTFLYFFLLFHSSPPTLFYNWCGFISCKVPEFSSFKSQFLSFTCIICSSHLLRYVLVFFFFTFVCWSFKCWFIQEKGKSPLRVLIYTSYTRSESLHSPSPTNVPCPAMKHSTVATPTRDRGVRVLSHMQRSARKHKTESQGHSFVLSSEGYLQKISVFTPRLSFNRLTMSSYIGVFKASSDIYRKGAISVVIMVTLQH